MQASKKGELTRLEMAAEQDLQNIAAAYEGFKKYREKKGLK